MWIIWLRDCVASARRFISEESISVVSEEERELCSVKCALYARALTLSEGCLLLIENDRQLDFRIHSRGVIECAIYLIALDRNPAFVSEMKDDDGRSRQKRAGLHLNARDFKGTEEVRKMLQDFVAQGLQGAKGIQIASLLEGSEFERFYRTYRDISGDAAHVSVAALNRHYVENPEDHSATLVAHPALDDMDFLVTVIELAMSMIVATLMLMKIRTKTETWDEFQELTRRYHMLVANHPESGTTVKS